MPTRARDQRSKAVVWHTAYLVIYRVVGKTLACVYPAQTVYTSAVENGIASNMMVASMRISILVG